MITECKSCGDPLFEHISHCPHCGEENPSFSGSFQPGEHPVESFLRFSPFLALVFWFALMFIGEIVGLPSGLIALMWLVVIAGLGWGAGSLVQHIRHRRAQSSRVRKER
jgi:hypothetical protein